MFRILFVLFLLVPLIEIYFLMKVGNIIGAGWTIFAVVTTAVLGAGLLRIQGASTLLRAQSSLAKGSLPAMEMMEGFALALSGILLLTPGFFTDALGFACLIPQIRRKFAKYVIENHLINVRTAGSPFQSTKAKDDNVLEGEFKKEE